MTFKLIKAIAKPISLVLLLLNVQLNLKQEAARAKTTSSAQFNNSSNLETYSQQKLKSDNLICSSQISKAIERITNRSEFKKARWGILIQTLSTAQTLYNHDAQKYFIPASNAKLLTTAAVLHKLGSQFQIRTSIYGTDDGYLRVVGRGDPSLTDVELRKLAQQLKSRKFIALKLIFAEDNYSEDAINSSWEWEDVQADYGTQVNSLIVNQNTVNLTLLPQSIGQPLRVTWRDSLDARQWQIENKTITNQPGEPTAINISRNLKGIIKISGQLNIDSEPELISLAVTDARQNFLQHFRRALIAEGIKESDEHTKIKMSEIVRHTLRLSIAPELATIESPPLSQLVIEINQNSNNLYAEALLRVLGVTTQDTSQNISEMGLAMVKTTLTKLGVDPTGYVLVDGSGLSRHNLVTPEAIAQTLRVMAKLPEAKIYRASLPVAGKSGTLKNRFLNTNAVGIVRAKTGTMSGVVALSGYIDAPNYQPLIFSIIVNQSAQPAAIIRQAIDDIILLLTRLKKC